MAIDLAEPSTGKKTEVPLYQEDGFWGPMTPNTLAETGIDPSILVGLALKLARAVPVFTTEWAAEQLHLPPRLMEEICQRLKESVTR